jgi:hypothetical protein
VTDDQFIAWLHRQGKTEKSRAVESYKYGRDPASFVRFESERGRKMQRDIDEVEALLDLWAEWMRKPEGPEGHRAAAGFLVGTMKESEDLYEAADSDMIARIDACFDSLAPLYKEAIMRKYGLGSRVFRFAKDATFEDAKIVIRVKMVMRGLI